MSLKKKRKSSCPFASANRADVLATIVIKNKIDGRTIPFVLAGRKLKAKAMTNLTNPQSRTHKSRGKVGRSINYCRRSPARISLNSFLSVLSRRYDFVGESFCKIRASFMLDRVLSKRGSLSRTVHFSNHKFLGALAFRSCNFLLDICTRTSLKVSLFTQTLFPCLRHLSSCFVRRNVNPH